LARHGHDLVLLNEGVVLRLEGRLACAAHAAYSTMRSARGGGAAGSYGLAASG
jgi:hypothetical protein